MKQKPIGGLRSLSIRQRLAIAVPLAVVLIFIIVQLIPPKRSVAAYCKVYNAEKARIAKLPGDTYPSLLFDHPLSDASEFITSLDRLERVTPNDIRPDVHTLKTLYQKLHDDPSQMLSVSFAAESIDKSASRWTASRCSK